MVWVCKTDSTHAGINVPSFLNNIGKNICCVGHIFMNKICTKEWWEYKILQSKSAHNWFTSQLKYLKKKPGLLALPYSKCQCVTVECISTSSLNWGPAVLDVLHFNLIKKLIYSMKNDS